MGKAITKNLGGRPTKYSEEIVTKLDSIFKVGGTVEESCAYAGISKETYYRWLEQNEGFMTKMASAQHYADVVAKNVVVDDIVKGRSVDTAKWWLEKRQFKTAQQQTNIQNNIVVVPSGVMEKYGNTRVTSSTTEDSRL